MAYAVAADNSVLSVAQFLAQSVTISSVQLNNQHIPTLSGERERGVPIVSLQLSSCMLSFSMCPLYKLKVLILHFGIILAYA